MVFVKNFQIFPKQTGFFHLSFYYEMVLEKVFNKILERKEALFYHEKHGFKNILKICIFSKELVHGFCQKI